ncbi:MAG TPA: hypothetical protein VLB44_25605 [Kofleriaceae bacterium]|nr:hypothetical protein [Kofleriaceae bacterium]
MRNPRSNGALLFGGDWAIAHGNVGGLANIARQLANRVTGSLRNDLVELSNLCSGQADLAVSRWYLLKPKLVA